MLYVVSHRLSVRRTDDITLLHGSEARMLTATGLVNDVGPFSTPTESALLTDR